MVHIAASVALAASLASLVASTPVEKRTISVPLTKKSSGSVSAKSIVDYDKARIAGLRGNSARPKPGASSGSATNSDVSYLATLAVGTQNFNLIVDTGSSNTWVGAGTKYVKSSSGTSTGNSVSVSYGSGSFSGTEYTDKVSYAGLTVTKQSIGVASKSTGFSGVDGIFGVGPVDLTQGTVSNTNTVPTFLDNLKSQGSISTEALGVYFKPESGSDTNDANGELTLGGVDSSKYTGTLTYTTKSSSGDFAYYWGVNTAGLTYGSKSVGGANGAIVDTGTTLIYVPTSSYNSFLSAAGGTTDSTTGLARFTTKPTSNFAIKIGSTSYTLTPAQFLVPTAQYTYFGLNSRYYYAWINDGGSSGVDFIIGQKFLENYYSVFDTTNNRIGFATRA